MQGYEGCLLFTWANGEKYSGLVNFIPITITITDVPLLPEFSTGMTWKGNCFILLF